MDFKLLVPFITIIALALVINAIIHFYFKRRHRQLLQELAGSEYYLSKNADIEMDFTSRFSVKYYYYTGDVIFSGNNIYLLKRSRYGFKQCAPVSVFTNKQSNLNVKNMAHFYFYDTLNLINGRLIIDTPKKGSLNAKVKAIIKLTDGSDSAELIEKFYLNPKP